MEFTNPFPGRKPGEKITKQELISALRLSICAEHDATHLYDTIAEYTDDERVKKIMKDVADEEQVHVGEFRKLLELFDADEEPKTKEGEEEAEEKMGSGSETETTEGKIAESLASDLTKRP